jgi:ABC-type transport system substrate-binding protein
MRRRQSGDAADDCSAEHPLPRPRRQAKDLRQLRRRVRHGLDSLDPGLSYTTQGWEALWNVDLSLLDYWHASGPDGATLAPALATVLPTVSADGLTYMLTLRRGLEYSDGSAVKASDFAYAIERDLLVNSLC